MRRAKIVCTIGPASANRKTISAMIKAGMNVARLNFSHGDYEFHGNIAAMVRQEAAKQKKTIAILQDLQGIKIRIGEVQGGQMLLKSGQNMLLYPGKEVSSGSSIFITYPALLKDVKKGDALLFDDGLIKMRVEGISKDGKALMAKVVEGGLLKSKKGVNLPDSKTSLSAFSDKDKKDLEFGLSIGVDYIAVSFVRSADDIKRVFEWAKKKAVLLPPIIAKIEKPEALDKLDEIIGIVDGIMVARGDLGVELPTERVPVVQKMLINLANKRGKLVITATQMLESMTKHTRPTRAEASDVANAVLDGTDALMLSAETTVGEYPVESVKMMDTIIRFTENSFIHKEHSAYEIGCSFPEATADAARKAAFDIGAKAIVVFTHSGFTAQLLSKLRPHVPIIAFTTNDKVLKRLALHWGVRGRFIKHNAVEQIDSAFMAEIERTVLSEDFVKKGDSIVFVASSPFMGKPNIIRLQKI
jgi:pyruvate kinase